MLPIRDPKQSAEIEGYKEVCSEEIPTGICKRTVEIVNSATLHLQLATKDYVLMDTQRLRSDVMSIVTVEVAIFLQYPGKEIVEEAITEAVHPPE